MLSIESMLFIYIFYVVGNSFEINIKYDKQLVHIRTIEASMKYKIEAH